MLKKILAKKQFFPQPLIVVFVNLFQRFEVGKIPGLNTCSRLFVSAFKLSNIPRTAMFLWRQCVVVLSQKVALRECSDLYMLAIVSNACYHR